MGLENRLSTLAGSLSGGQRQALALIMATMIRPDLLLLDEHTAALDPKSSDTVMMLTDKIVHEKNITTIMVTHNLRHAVEHGTRTVMTVSYTHLDVYKRQVLRHVTAVVYRVQLKLHLLYLTYLVILMKFLYVWDMKLTVKLSEISLQQTSLKEQSLF